tara:strand:- start:1420 stop:2310 length:891 start_codon:yes stop_codon:yes gene_type:complete
MKSKVVIGLWPLSGDFGDITTSQFEETTNYIIDSGIKSFDVAPNYGHGFAEKSLGEIYQGKEDLVINTKFGNSVNGEKEFDVSNLRKSLESSLKRLRVENINTLFLHNPRDEIIDYEPIEYLMSDLKKERLINKSAISVAKGYEYKYLPIFDSVQFDCNLLYLKELKIYKEKFENCYARSPLATGILSGKVTKESTFPENDQRSEWLHGVRLKSILKRVDSIKKQANGLNISTLSRKFLLQNADLDYVIFGVKNKLQVKDILIDIETPKIDEGLIESLFKLENKNFGLSGEDTLGF